jgi:hypothetical protein
MTYRELFYKAQRLVDKDEITLGEYEEMTKPLDREIEQEPQTFRWCTTCKEYDQEKHCCHRWTKVIRNTVEEMKQEYIEREVLDKIDEIITDALDNSTDQKESQTLRWVLDKISEVM